MSYKRIFKTIKNYNICLTYDDEGNLVLDKSLCDCEFGSWWRFTNYWEKRKKLCRHMIIAIQEEKNDK